MEAQDIMPTYPNFSTPIREKIERFPENEPCTLMSADDSFDVSEDDIRTIASICSEDLVFNTLFKDIPKFSSGYTEEHARGFIEKAKQGWRENTTFIFLIRDSANNIIAAIDIKTNDLDAGEVGYWATSKKPGVMTSATMKLCEVAKNAGYRKLFALVRLENARSSNMILRAGFDFVGQEDRKGKGTIYNRYEKQL